MPYLSEHDKHELDLTYLDSLTPTTAGQLNYSVTRLALNFLYRSGTYGYADINAAVGALECAKQELYRRLAAPYEDQKIQANGDVRGFPG